MKLILVLIKPFRLEGVLEGLPLEGVHDVLVTDGRGYGRQKGHLDMYKEHEYELAFLPKAHLEIYCEDAATEPIVAAIQAKARTGRIGDGKIMILNVEQALE